jgi:hypothetical protein
MATSRPVAAERSLAPPSAAGERGRFSATTAEAFHNDARGHVLKAIA